MKCFYPWCIVVVFLLVACGEAGEKLNKELLPTAGGDIGEIVLVMDSTQWTGDLGGQIKETFRSPMVGLPQDEALFALKKINPIKLNNLLKTAANLVFVMTLDSDTDESKSVRKYFSNQALKRIQRDSSIWMTVRQDEYAKGQIALYLFGQDEKALTENIYANKKRIRDFFESQAQKRLKAKIYRQRERGLEKAIAEKQDVAIQVPYGWDLAKNLPNFSWLRFLEADRELDVFIYQEPYRSVEVFDDVAALRDKATELFLRDAEKPDIYITRQDIIPMYQDKVTFDGKFAIKSRGLWKVSDNSGGGPFVSYTMVDEEKQMVYYIEGYVYSPGTNKKNFVRQVDAILSTFKTKSAS